MCSGLDPHVLKHGSWGVSVQCLESPASVSTSHPTELPGASGKIGSKSLGGLKPTCFFVSRSYKHDPLLEYTAVNKSQNVWGGKGRQ